MFMWMRVYYERKVVILQSVAVINRVGKIIHYRALLFYKRLNQDEYGGFWDLNLWRISSIEF